MIKITLELSNINNVLNRNIFVMALIKCNECGQMVSDKASNCPQCGAPINTQIVNNTEELTHTPKLKIIIEKGFILRNTTLEIKSENNIIGEYPFRSEFEVEIPVYPKIELTFYGYKIKLALNTNENYTCKINASFLLSYELSNDEGKIIKSDKTNFFVSLISFFIPIIGLIYYFVSKENSPLKAKSALNAALIGFILSFIHILKVIFTE